MVKPQAQKGSPQNFFKLTYNMLSNTLLEVYNGIWDGGTYLPSGHQANIKIDSKKGKDPTILDHIAQFSF